MKKMTTWCAALAMLAGASSAMAAPIQLSIPGQNFPAEQQVEGVRFAFLNGKTHSVEGINISILGLSEVDQLKGIDLGFFFGASRVKSQFTGAAFTLVNWHQGHDTGLNVGFVNLVNQVDGFNLAAVNVSEGNSLANLGFINYAGRTTFQLGFVNATKQLDGLQIGLVNFAENGVLPVMPLVNFNKSF